MNSKSSKSGLFLMELIMSILFFSLAATVCVQMFVKGHSLSEESVRLNHCVICCQGLADSFYGCDGNIHDINRSVVNSIITNGGNGIAVFFDENFNNISNRADCRYCVEGFLKPEDDLLTLDIICTDMSDGNIIYELSPTLYPQNEP